MNISEFEQSVSKHIHELISQGESQNLDFKYEISDAKKIARTLSAFANTDGGTLLVGVRDNGAIAGIKTDEEVYMIESAADIYCQPPVSYSFKNWNINGKNVLEIIVEESTTKPHFAPWKDDWKAFIRVHDENYIANSVQVEVWKKKYLQQPSVIKYNTIEQNLLAYLAANNSISLRGFCKLCKIKYPLAKKILANLVSIGVLKINFAENSATYSRTDN